MKPLVYIAHPLGDGPDRERNLRNATLWCGWAGDQGVAPVAPWITLATIWPETKRELGLAIDVAVVARCDALWLVGGRISPGMAIEAKAASGAGVLVVDRTHLGFLPPDHCRHGYLIELGICGFCAEAQQS